ncbi:Platelet-activating factor acetylhydrolase [Escovopsis weberi]|uniref:1-alkyl-2-acetylglycerophosphocholine esterase n=1 Tax=Escovopsis weberi TaxID=150374 RepID=A0A0M8N777_ESCWE|nr:Platelet-activating factor acetylhydrolase [Escovopsis weberi]
MSTSRCVIAAGHLQPARRLTHPSNGRHSLGRIGSRIWNCVRTLSPKHADKYKIARSAVSKAQVSNPRSPYNVTIRTSQLDDFDRAEIFSNETEHRRLMISVFSPLVDDEHEPVSSPPCRSPYMPREVAVALTTLYSASPPPSNFTIEFSRLFLQACSVDVTYGSPPDDELSESQRSTAAEEFPLVIFGPGLGFSRLTYNLLCQFLASYGFIVVSVDHPHDAAVVQFSDGSFAFFSSEVQDSDAHLERNLLIRTADVSFVLDQLGTNDTLARLVYPRGVKPCSVESAGIWGHSFGGATAVTALLRDARFKGGMNIDGTVFGPAPRGGIDGALVLWQSELADDGTPRTEFDSTWVELWSHLRGYKKHLQMKGGQHRGLTDLKLLADLLGTRSPSFGTIDGLLELQTLAICARDFFGFVLEGKEPGLLSGPSKDYPHVEFLQ